MATASTSLLGLALPVTGELSGTWGQTVNDSITALLDSAVAGTTTLSTDADITLTTTTLAANQARQAILLCSGARTAQRTITAPAQSKIYTIINATSGGFDVKIVGAGPTTGLTIANGASAVVAWNGSDFIEIGSSTAGNFTVNGNLTVTGTASAAKLIPTGGTAAGNGLYLPSANTLALSTNGTERMQIGSAGTFGYGTSALTGYGHNNLFTNLSGVDIAGDYMSLTAGSGTTSSLKSYTSAISTSAASFTLASVQHFTARQITIGAGSAVTNQYGFIVLSSLTGATNNYSFYGNIPSGTGRYNLYMAGTADNYIAGTLGLGTIFGLDSTQALRIGKTLTGNTASYSVVNSPIIASDVTSTFAGYFSVPTTQASAFTLSSLQHFGASGITIGSGSAVTNQYGFLAGSGLIGATNNYSFYGDIPSGTGRWNLYMAGTADNYLAGNLGLGVVPSAWSSGWKAIDLGAYSAFANDVVNDGALSIANNAYANSATQWIYKSSLSSGAGRYSMAGTTHKWYTAPSGTAGNAITFTQAMTLDASGNLLVGTTSNTNSAKVTAVSSSSGSYYQMMMNNTDTGTGSQISMDIYRNSTRVGYITTTNTTCAFTSISDYRLKENIIPMQNALAKVSQLRPVNYTWKLDGSLGQGFIAHEIQAVFPDAVHGEKDETNNDGSIKPQAIDTSFLVATLTAAIQEQQASITQLTKRITALENK